MVMVFVGLALFSGCGLSGYLMTQRFLAVHDAAIRRDTLQQEFGTQSAEDVQPNPPNLRIAGHTGWLS